MIRLDDQNEVVYVQLIDFGRNVRASEAVTPNDDGSFTIFVNSRLSTTRQKEAVKHALLHIGHHDFQKADVQQIEAEAHGIKPEPQKVVVPEKTARELYIEKRNARFAEMRKKNQRKRKKLQKELREREAFINYLTEHNEKYSRDHTIF